MKLITFKPFTTNDGVQYFHDEEGNIFMEKPDKEPINIGKLLMLRSGRSLHRCYIKHEKETQRFRKLDAWSINESILHLCDMIFYITEKDKYKISKTFALTAGVFREYKGESKLYVPVSYWQKQSEL